MFYMPCKVKVAFSLGFWVQKSRWGNRGVITRDYPGRNMLRFSKFLRISRYSEWEQLSVRFHQALRKVAETHCTTMGSETHARSLSTVARQIGSNRVEFYPTIQSSSSSDPRRAAFEPPSRPFLILFERYTAVPSDFPRGRDFLSSAIARGRLNSRLFAIFC